MTKIMNDCKLQIDDIQKCDTFDPNLKHYFEFVEEAQKRFVKSLGGEKTFSIQRANVEYFNYIKELFQLLTNRVLDNF